MKVDEIMKLREIKWRASSGSKRKLGEMRKGQVEKVKDGKVGEMLENKSREEGKVKKN